MCHMTPQSLLNAQRFDEDIEVAPRTAAVGPDTTEIVEFALAAQRSIHCAVDAVVAAVTAAIVGKLRMDC